MGSLTNVNDLAACWQVVVAGVEPRFDEECWDDGSEVIRLGDPADDYPDVAAFDAWCDEQDAVAAWTTDVGEWHAPGE